MEKQEVITVPNLLLNLVGWRSDLPRNDFFILKYSRHVFISTSLFAFVYFLEGFIPYVISSRKIPFGAAFFTVLFGTFLAATAVIAGYLLTDVSLRKEKQQSWYLSIVLFGASNLALVIIYSFLFVDRSPQLIDVKFFSAKYGHAKDLAIFWFFYALFFSNIFNLVCGLDLVSKTEKVYRVKKIMSGIKHYAPKLPVKVLQYTFRNIIIVIFIIGLIPAVAEYKYIIALPNNTAGMQLATLSVSRDFFLGLIIFELLVWFRSRETEIWEHVEKAEDEEAEEKAAKEKLATESLRQQAVPVQPIQGDTAQILGSLSLEASIMESKLTITISDKTIPNITEQAFCYLVRIATIRKTRPDALAHRREDLYLSKRDQELPPIIRILSSVVGKELKTGDVLDPMGHKKKILVFEPEKITIDKSICHFESIHKERARKNILKLSYVFNRLRQGDKKFTERELFMKSDIDKKPFYDSIKPFVRHTKLISNSCKELGFAYQDGKWIKEWNQLFSKCSEIIRKFNLGKIDYRL